MDNYFAKLNAINVSDKTEKKNNLTYLSWAWAWGEVKKQFPDATYTIYENENGWPYHTDGRTCWVKTGVTVAGIEHIEYLPIMDFKNFSIPLEKVTSYDVNKTIQRSLTKACARHGLGLYIYAGEDLPECEKAPEPMKEEKPEPNNEPEKAQEPEGRFIKVVQPKLDMTKVMEIKALAESAGVDLEEVKRQANIKELDELSDRGAEQMKKALQRKIIQRRQDGSQG